MSKKCVHKKQNIFIAFWWILGHLCEILQKLEIQKNGEKLTFDFWEKHFPYILVLNTIFGQKKKLKPLKNLLPIKASLATLGNFQLHTLLKCCLATMVHLRKVRHCIIFLAKAYMIILVAKKTCVEMNQANSNVFC